MRRFSMQVILLAACAVAALWILAVPGFASAPDWNQYQHDAAHSGRNSQATGPVWPQVVPGWPVDCALCAWFGGSGPVVSEVVVPGGERVTGIFAGSRSSNDFENSQDAVYAFDSGGRALPGWPFLTPGEQDRAIRGAPAVGTVGGESAVFASAGYRPTKTYAIGSNGQALAGGWPWVSDPEASADYGPTLALDSYGNQTMYVRVKEGSEESHIYALDSSGTAKPGWPVNSGPNESGFFSPAPDSPVVAPDNSVYAKSSEGPIGGDGRHGLLLGLLPSGEPKPGWPFTFPDSQNLIFSSPAVGDDGTVYVAATYWTAQNIATSRSYLYAFSSTGRVKPGWPREVPGLAFGTPAIAADGTANFLVTRAIRPGPETDSGTSISVYALSARGEQKQGWPKAVYTSQHGRLSLPPLWGLALDREGNLYVTGGTNFLHDETNYSAVLNGFTPQGANLPGWPLRLSGKPVLFMPAIGNDGTLYATGFGLSAGHNQSKLYAIRSGSKPPRCDPRWSDRLCPPRLLKGGTQVGDLMPAGGR